MAGVYIWVSLGTEYFGYRFSDSTWASIRGDFGVQNNINAGILQALVGKMMVHFVIKGLSINNVSVKAGGWGQGK